DGQHDHVALDGLDGLQELAGVGARRRDALAHPAHHLVEAEGAVGVHGVADDQRHGDDHDSEVPDQVGGDRGRAVGDDGDRHVDKSLRRSVVKTSVHVMSYPLLPAKATAAATWEKWLIPWGKLPSRVPSL